MSQNLLTRVVVAVVIITGGVAFPGRICAQDPAIAGEDLYAAIRANELTKLEAMLQSGADPNTPDLRGGATPLMHAAAVGSVDAMRMLLARGAKVNLAATNGATPLMWAATDIDKVRLLLDNGADVKAVSQRGRSALYLAAKSDASASIVKLLLAAGADATAVDALKSTILHAATLGNDIHTIRLLVERGLDVNAADVAGVTPIINAASNDNLDAVRLLLSRKADVNARSGPPFNKVKAGTVALGHWTALNSAAAYGSPAMVRTLLDAGAQVDIADARGMTPLMLAVASDRQSADVIRLLVERGADVRVKSATGETALDWARKIGSPTAIEILKRAGGVETPSNPPVIPAAAHVDLKTSVERSLALLRSASVVSAANGGCASCHSHNIVDVAESRAKAKGVAVDEKLIAQRQVLTKAPFFSPAGLFDRFDPPVPELSAYALIGLAAGGYAADRMTDAVAVNLMAQQRADGRWYSGSVARPPIEDGDIFRTALAIRALALYGPPGRGAEIRTRIATARNWLGSAKAITAEDRNMQLLGLHWAGVFSDGSAAKADAASRNRVVKAILSRQRADGGWSQNEHLSSDAYATGQSLYALAEAGGMATQDSAFSKGVRYLLSTQRPDGSWYVSSRSPKFQPYFDGGFPYEHDQWISSMATGWAAAALATALPGN